MNITPLTIYLWQLADSLKDGLFTICILTSVICVIATPIICMMRSDNEVGDATWAKLARAFKCLMAFWIVGGFTAMLIPSSNTIAMMVIIPKIAESKAIQQDLPDLYDAAVKALKEQLAPKKP